MKTTESVSMSYRSFCTTKDLEVVGMILTPPPPEKFTLVKLPQIGLGPPFHPGKHNNPRVPFLGPRMISYCFQSSN